MCKAGGGRGAHLHAAVCRGLTQLNGYCTDDTTMDLTDVYEYIAHRAETTVSFYYSSVRVCREQQDLHRRPAPAGVARTLNSLLLRWRIGR